MILAELCFQQNVKLDFTMHFSVWESQTRPREEQHGGLQLRDARRDVASKTRHFVRHVATDDNRDTAALRGAQGRQGKGQC